MYKHIFSVSLLVLSACNGGVWGGGLGNKPSPTDTGDTQTGETGGGETGSETETGGETDTDSGGTDTGDTDTGEQPPVDCFRYFGRGTGGSYSSRIDRSVMVSTKIESISNGQPWSYVDAESVIRADTTDGGSYRTVTVSDPDGYGYTWDIPLPDPFPSPESGEVGNGKVVLNVAGELVELNWYYPDSETGWVLPDAWLQTRPTICQASVNNLAGADAGAHQFTALGMILIDQLNDAKERIEADPTNPDSYDLGGMFHVSLDNSILGCEEGATDRSQCHTDYTNDADWTALTSYHGDLLMGNVMEISWDEAQCMTLPSTFGKIFCITSYRWGVRPTDRANDSQVAEMQFNLENGGDAIIRELDGESLVNNGGQIHTDLNLLKTSGAFRRITNATVAIPSLAL